ncbi:hypothetical protein JTE90_003632 [Oedothorax gibbosus]|uniref:Uncharacterized protein n=1 Tax=Oedothorax gibbosus TaxID=931172 RepID=A0AAV6TNF6_9ARAC|nr:hypothetical protein JTE90_003632 [Oedothorax gibbosus]
MQMREGCLPSKFECRPDRRKRTPPSVNPRSAVVKRQKLSSSLECQNIVEEYRNNQVVEAHDAVPVEGVKLYNVVITKCSATSPLKPSLKSVSTSPINTCKSQQSTIRRIDNEEVSSSNEEVSETSPYSPNFSDSDSTFTDEAYDNKLFQQQS